MAYRNNHPPKFPTDPAPTCCFESLRRWEKQQNRSWNAEECIMTPRGRYSSSTCISCLLFSLSPLPLLLPFLAIVSLFQGIGGSSTLLMRTNLLGGGYCTVAISMIPENHPCDAQHSTHNRPFSTKKTLSPHFAFDPWRTHDVYLRAQASEAPRTDPCQVRRDLSSWLRQGQ